MLTYRNSGIQHYGIAPVVNTCRPAWEFQACLSGVMAASLMEPNEEDIFRGQTLWAFPMKFTHGWRGRGEEGVERVVFHHTVVPEELSRLIPKRGYYRVALSDSDCDRIRLLADLAREIGVRPTEFLPLQTRAIVDELSLMALREVPPRPLPSRNNAVQKTEQALAWFREHMVRTPSLDEVARAVFVSPAHLRRLFHEAKNESPHQALNRLRMEFAMELLTEPGVGLEIIAPRTGFSSASALSRAIKAHFGLSPRELRNKIRFKRA